MTPDERRTRIIYHLSRHPRLTTLQIAKLAYDNQGVHIKAGRTYPNSLSAATAMLKRMAKDKLVKQQKGEHQSAVDLYMLPDIPRVTPTKKTHEITKGDLYVAYYEVERWYNELSIGAGLRSDCSMVYNGVPVHFEVDLATEPMENLFEKIENYIRHCPSGDKTVFVLKDGVRRTAKTTGSNLHAYLSERKRGRQFSWTRIDLIMGEPYGAWLFNSLPEKITLDELCAT
jgi:hypothetical protein